MTAQFRETLRYLGEDVSMCAEPLGDYFLLGPSIRALVFRHHPRPQGQAVEVCPCRLRQHLRAGRAAGSGSWGRRGYTAEAQCTECLGWR